MSILATRAFYLTWHCHVAGKYAVNPLKSKWNIQRGHLGYSLARSRTPPFGAMAQSASRAAHLTSAAPCQALYMPHSPLPTSPLARDLAFNSKAEPCLGIWISSPTEASSASWAGRRTRLRRAPAQCHRRRVGCRRCRPRPACLCSAAGAATAAWLRPGTTSRRWPRASGSPAAGSSWAACSGPRAASRCR